jgi:hypothetical protein
LLDSLVFFAFLLSLAFALWWCFAAVAGIRDAPHGASVAPVRGGTYFSLQRQRKVGKRKPLTPSRLTRFIWT